MPDWPYVGRIDEMLDRTGAVAVAVGVGRHQRLVQLASFHHGQSYLCVGYGPLRSTVIRRRRSGVARRRQTLISKPMRRW